MYCRYDCIGKGSIMVILSWMVSGILGAGRYICMRQWAMGGEDMHKRTVPLLHSLFSAHSYSYSYDVTCSPVSFTLLSS